jgi:hypothetical protein
MNKIATLPHAPSDQLQEAADVSPAHENELLDEGLEESFPASDPAAVSITRIVEDKKEH